VLEQVVQASSLWGFGAQGAARSLAEPRAWRLSLQRLGASVYEYPCEAQDGALVMAHCEARLAFAAHFVRGSRVLEAGCGTGLGARLFRASGAAHVLGLDYSEDALRRARAATADEAIEYRQWDLNRTPLPLPSEQFDVVVCMEVLEHVQEHAALIAEFRRVLVPGGRLILSVPDKNYEEACAGFNGYRNIYHVRVPDRVELKQLLAGFDQVRYARQIDFTGSAVVEDNAADLVGGFRGCPTDLDLDPVETILTVGVKLPAEAARPVPPFAPHLCLFDNALGRDLGARRHGQNLERALREVTYQRCTEANRADLAIDDLGTRLANRSADQTVTERELMKEWLQGGAEAYVRGALYPGEWMQQLAVRFSEAAGIHLPGPVAPRRSPWELWISGTDFHLRPGSERPRDAHTVVFPRPATAVPFKTLWRWDRAGASTVWFLEPEGWKQYDLRGHLAWRMYRRLVRATPSPVANWLGLADPQTQGRVALRAMRFFRRQGLPEVFYPHGTNPHLAWKEWVAEGEGESPVRPTGRPLKVLQYTGSLNCGGAERQLCNLALGLARRSTDVNVLTTCPLDDDRGHYLQLLHDARIPVREASRPAVGWEALAAVPWHLLQAVPLEVQESVLSLAFELIAGKPDVLHCWLDQPNVIGAIAGLMARVPHIIFSTRNANPTNFSRLFTPYMQKWYRLAAQSGRVHFIANSHSGAASYADWLGIPVERFHVIFNGLRFDHFPEPTPEARRQARALFGLRPSDRVVSGVFRLAAEKQPELFLKVIGAVRAQVPGLRVLMAGTGDLEKQVAEKVRALGLEDCVRMLGRRSDVGNVFLASDGTLLTSLLEGCPNVALESQYLGVPIVATAGGGTADAVLHGQTGFLTDTTDAGGLARYLTQVLTDDALRSRLAASGPAFVKARFSPEQMVEQTFAVYEVAFGRHLGRRRIVPEAANSWPTPQGLAG
jgi:glycosyltransferase involved in cell wall biosynthesis/SAM-dependent methyltransferase